jgi:hypothetical protein
VSTIQTAHSPIHPQEPVTGEQPGAWEKLVADLPKHLEGLNPGRLVTYNDSKGVDHVSLVVDLVDGSGRVNLLVAARFPGDETWRLVESVRYSPTKSQGYWRWPERGPHNTQDKPKPKDKESL